MKKYLALLVGFMLFAVSACASAGAVDSNKTVRKIECGVKTRLSIKTTEHRLAKAKQHLARDTPEEADAKVVVKNLKSRLGKLYDHAKACAKQSAPTNKRKVNHKKNALTALPVVDGGDPLRPLVGSGDDPRTPDVRPGGIVTGWTGLDSLLGSDQSYKNCASSVVPKFDWSRDVPAFKQTEKQGHDSRYILAVHTLANDVQIRATASKAVGEDVSNLEILRVDAIINTRGFKQGGCDTFFDRRAMVRVSLGKVVYNPDGSVKGLANDGGVFVDCHNPWKLVPPAPAPVPGKTPSPTPPRHNPPPTYGCPPGTVPYNGRCVKPASDDGHGGNQSPRSQPVAEHPQGSTPGAPANEPPPATRPQGDPNGGSGDGGAGPATGPVDTSHGGDTTTVETPVTCPFGPGNC